MLLYLKKCVSVWAILLLVVGCKNETAKDDKPVVQGLSLSNQFKKSLDSIYTSNKDAIGIMVHVISPNDSLSWSGAVGFADKDSTKILAIDQPILIASNTKTYVATTILRLFEEDKLHPNDAIAMYLSKYTDSTLLANGYKTSDIKIKHLMSHTSGVFDYASTDDYFEFVQTNPNHRWSRDEQISWAMSNGEPLGLPNDVFSYSDTNYLLLTEIIEQIAKAPFYSIMREFIDYNKLGMHTTWFETLEDKPKNSKLMARQYVTSMGIDSYTLDPSFDLYGGGGLASTIRDLAMFSQHLCTNKIFKRTNTLGKLFTKANPKQPMEGDYYYGISSIDINGTKGYGHGGFWGTAVNYFPELNASIAICVLDRDKRILRLHINQEYVKILKKAHKG